jgi:DNA-directed RNA polymerase specialized sigma24 family protein
MSRHHRLYESRLVTLSALQTWARDLDGALTELLPQEECFLRLSYFDGLRSERIANIAGVPVEYVRRVMAQGMQRLAGLIEVAVLPT